MINDSTDLLYPPTFSLLGDDLLNPPPVPGSSVHHACSTLAREARALHLPDRVEEVMTPPSPADMARVYVGGNKPLLIKGGVGHWPAITKWNIPYLRKRVGELVVSVAVTPSGFADAPNGGYFVLPEEREMVFNRFLDVMERPHTQHGVWYVQHQNSSLTEQFSALMADLDSDGGSAGEVPWFTQTMGKQPDAVNFWMGDERAVTSMHKDPYENIYCVISGYKDFILIPPSDAPWVPYKKYPVAYYHYRPPGKTGSSEPLGEQSPVASCNEVPDEMSCTGSHEQFAVCGDQEELNEGRKRADSAENNGTQNEGLYDEKLEPVNSTLKREQFRLREEYNNNTKECICGYRTDLVSNSKQTVINEYLEDRKCDNSCHQESLEKMKSISSSFLPVNCLHSSSKKPRGIPSCPMFSIVPVSPAATVPWICLDPRYPSLLDFPQYRNARPLRVRVMAGDALYLPSLWFHHVSQSHACIAVNYWYDMDYGPSYSYYQMVQALTWKQDALEDDSS